MTEAYCMDCMEYMASLPDKAFNLAIIDPPYGDALGGANGTDLEAGSRDTKWNRFGQRFEKYRIPNGGGMPQSTATRLQTGILHHHRSISMSFFVYQRIRSYGVEITLAFPLPDASLCGIRRISQRISLWRCVNMHGQVSMERMRSLFAVYLKAQKMISGSIQHRNQLKCINSACNILHRQETEFWTHIWVRAVSGLPAMIWDLIMLGQRLTSSISRKRRSVSSCTHNKEICSRTKNWQTCKYSCLCD